MNIFFDVDDTLITWDVKLRPHVHDVFARIQDDGHAIYLWSGHGPRWEVVRRFDLHRYITDCFWKPLHNHRARLSELGVPFPPDFAVDDHAEIVEVFGGLVIEPADSRFGREDEMWRVYDEIASFAREQKQHRLSQGE